MDQIRIRTRNADRIRIRTRNADRIRIQEGTIELKNRKIDNFNFKI